MAIKLWVEEFQEFYNWADSISDSRTARWLFVPSILSPAVFVIAYLVLIWLLPKVMKDKEPFQLTNLLLLYNTAMVLLNFYISVELFLSTTAAGYSYSCQKFNPSYEPKELRVTSVLWWFYFSKIVELLDTIFFLLRKKNNQVSFLHVYHHITMVCLWWIGIKWVPSGQSFFSAMVNSLVHTIMYSYYGLSAVPQLKKYLWWKRHLTQIQLTQFCVLLVHAVMSLYVKCDYPLWMMWTFVCYMISFLFLFSNFYIQTYFAATSGKRKPNKANGETVTNGDVLADGMTKPQPVKSKKQE